MMNSQNNAAAGQKDYVDKALDSAERKFGGKHGQNPDKFRSVNEKIVGTQR